MKSTSIINQALIDNGLLPLDGHVGCSNCGAEGLNRSDAVVIGRYEIICNDCKALQADDNVRCECAREEYSPGQWSTVECGWCAAGPKMESLIDLVKPVSLEGLIDEALEKMRINDPEAYKAYMNRGAYIDEDDERREYYREID